jgi:hypothetical protein
MAYLIDRARTNIDFDPNCGLIFDRIVTVRIFGSLVWCEAELFEF